MVSCHACVLSAFPKFLSLAEASWHWSSTGAVHSTSAGIIFLHAHKFLRALWTLTLNCSNILPQTPPSGQSSPFGYPDTENVSSLTSKMYKHIIWDILLIYPKDFFCCPDIWSYRSFRGSNLSSAFVVLHWTGAKVFHFSSEKVQPRSFRYPLCTYVAVWVYNF